MIQFNNLDVSGKGCNGFYGIKVNATDGCKSFVDYAPFEVSCGPKIVAAIDHCQTSRPGICDLDEAVPASSAYPGNYQMLVMYDYTSR